MENEEITIGFESLLENCPTIADVLRIEEDVRE